MLQAVQQLHDPNGQPPGLGLVSDFFPLPEEIAQRQQEYYDILQRLRIRSFFEPVETHVTLSTEMVSLIFKPDERIFRKAIERLSGNKAFITEDLRSQAGQGQERTCCTIGSLPCF